MLPHAAGVGRDLRGGRGLRRLRVAGRRAVAVVGDVAQGQDGDGKGRDADIAAIGAVPGDEPGAEVAPRVHEPHEDRDAAGAELGQAVHEVLSLAVDARAAAVGLGALGDDDGDGGWGRGGDGRTGLFHDGGLQGPGK